MFQINQKSMILKNKLPKNLYTCIFFNEDLNLFVCYYNIYIMTCVKSKNLEECLYSIKKDLYNYNLYNNKTINFKDIKLTYMTKNGNKKRWRMHNYGDLNNLYNLVI